MANKILQAQLDPLYYERQIIDLAPEEAYALLRDKRDAYLIDVRTQPEWTFVGTPKINQLGKRLIKLSWRIYPHMIINPEFIQEIRKQIPDRDSELIFLCRSGGRSMDAAVAMLQAGYKHCYNIVDGFEGPADIDGHRGNISGWKAVNLPWEQQ